MQERFIHGHQIEHRSTDIVSMLERICLLSNNFYHELKYLLTNFSTETIEQNIIDFIGIVENVTKMTL